MLLVMSIMMDSWYALIHATIFVLIKLVIYSNSARVFFFLIFSLLFTMNFCQVYRMTNEGLMPVLATERETLAVSVKFSKLF
jgi:hypothetical protein